MTDPKEKLIELLDTIHHKPLGKTYQERIETIAEHLIKNGVKFATDTNVGGNQISYDERKAIYARALWARGQNTQMVVAIEELSEVQKELCKMYRREGDMEHLAEEIADATIMLEQMRCIFGLNEQVCRYMDQKMKRLQDDLPGSGQNG